MKRWRHVMAVVCLMLSMVCAFHGCSDSSSLAPVFVSRELPPVFADAGSAIEHDFEVRNDTDTTVRISTAQASCGCSQAEVEDDELAPGEETVLHVKANVGGREGPFSTTCRLVNDSGQPWVYELRTTLYPRIKFAPDALRLGVVKPNEELTREVTLATHSRAGTPPSPELVLDGEYSEMVQFAENATTIERQPAGMATRETKLTVHVTPEAVAGFGRAELLATVSDGGKESKSVLEIEWLVESPYVVSPSRAFFGNVGRSDERVERLVTVRRVDGERLKIVDARANRPAVNCSVMRGEKDDQYRIVVTLIPRQIDGFLYGEVTVKTDDSLHPKIKIPFAASR